MVVLILIDAFRWDYIARTAYIKGLAETGVQGCFIEPFGFVPRDCYFGGRTPEETGYTHMFHYDPERSPFTIGSGLKGLPRELEFGQDTILRTGVRDRALRYVTPFVRKYLSSSNIPLSMIDQFNLSEQYAPWEKGKGYTSIFDLLDRAGKPWFQCSWPYTNEIQPNDDKGLTRHCVSQITERHEFAYIHLTELDSHGHQFGAESWEVYETIQNTDRCIQALHKHCLKVSNGNLTFILFGDHGMVTITRQIDIWGELQKTGLKFKHDYCCFLDSTMARFWFQHAAAKKRITAMLEGMPGGYVLKETDLKRFKITHCRPGNAELYFMAHPGAVIQPNFFDFSPRCTIKGMHGYDPESYDNRGAILYHRADGRVRGRFDEGFQSWNLFPLLLENLGIDHPTLHKIPSFTSVPAGGQDTLTNTPEAEPFVRQQIATAVQEIVAAIPAAKSIYLTGGFGRGEGTVKQTPDGFEAINDYDIGVIVEKPQAFDSKALGRKLANQFKMDYVDIAVTEPFNEYWGVTQQNFDTRHGSRVLWGDSDIFEKMPFYHGNQIPVYDACRLIYNRMAGFLTTEIGHRDGRMFIAEERRYYFAYQFVKASIALGDSLLMAWGAYDVSYAKRHDRLAELLKAFPEIDATERELILRGYQSKLELYTVDFDSVLRQMERIPDLTVRVLQLIGPKLSPDGGTPTSLKDCFLAVEESYLAVTDVTAENKRIAAEFGVAVAPSVRAYRQRLYQVILALCFAMLAADPMKAAYWRTLAALAQPLGGSVPDKFDWDQAIALQRRYMEIWEKTCH